MKPIIVMSGLALFAFASAAHAEAPQFSASCPMNIKVKSNGSGKIKINGQKAKVKTLNANAWEARLNGVTIDIAMDGSGLMVSYTAKGGANGICEVQSASTSKPSGMPSKDEQACLQAVSQETNNGDVVLLKTETSEANNTVIIGVGPQRAKWKCLVKNGRVAEVSSLTDEGSL